ncbi:hypothetical protein ACU4GD_17830 [Cupriavidus basilensis]
MMLDGRQEAGADRRDADVRHPVFRRDDRCRPVRSGGARDSEGSGRRSGQDNHAGTSVLAVLVSLDGDGSTTYMITCAAMLPLYKRLGISRLVLACVVMMAGGLMNILAPGRPGPRAPPVRRWTPASPSCR